MTMSARAEGAAPEPSCAWCADTGIIYYVGDHTGAATTRRCGCQAGRFDHLQPCASLPMCIGSGLALALVGVTLLVRLL